MRLAADRLSCECPSGFWWDSTANNCIQGSIKGHYQDTSGIWRPCDSSCTSCYGPSNQECLECVSWRRLEANQCHCKNGYYFDHNVSTTASTSGVVEDPCKLCDASCATCLHPDEAKGKSSTGGACTSCNSGFIQFKDPNNPASENETVFQCVCPKNTILNLTSQSGSLCEAVNLNVITYRKEDDYEMQQDIDYSVAYGNIEDAGGFKMH